MSFFVALALTLTAADPVLAIQQKSDEALVEIHLKESTKKIKGVDPALIQRRASRLVFLNETRPVVVRLKSETVKMVSHHTILTIDDDKVHSVWLKPVSPATDFATCVAAVEKICKDVGISDDKLVKARLKDWNTRMPEFSVSLGGSVDGVKVFVEIDTVVVRLGTKKADRKWFVVVNLN